MNTSTAHTLHHPRVPGRRGWTLLTVCLAITFSALPAGGANTGEVEVPGFTGYLDPVGRGARIDSRRGITGWTSQDVTIQFYVHLKTAGRLTLALKMSLPDSDDTANGTNRSRSACRANSSGAVPRFSACSARADSMSGGTTMCIMLFSNHPHCIISPVSFLPRL